MDAEESNEPGTVVFPEQEEIAIMLSLGFICTTNLASPLALLRVKCNPAATTVFMRNMFSLIRLYMKFGQDYDAAIDFLLEHFRCKEVIEFAVEIGYSFEVISEEENEKISHKDIEDVIPDKLTPEQLETVNKLLHGSF